MSKNSIIYYKSLNRQFHILGIDRQLFFLLLGLCVPIAYSARFNFFMDLFALLIFMVGYVAAVFITRSDSQLLSIYLKHIRYRHFYAAQPSVLAKIRLVKPSVPIYLGKRGLL